MPSIIISMKLLLYLRYTCAIGSLEDYNIIKYCNLFLIMDIQSKRAKLVREHILISKIREIFGMHFINNQKSYTFLLIMFAIGVAAGALTVNGLSAIQSEELANYFNGFLQLLDNQEINGWSLFSVSLMDNIKITGLLWLLGLTIIGIPLIFITLAVKGFIIGFSAGFVIKAIGLKGIVFTIFAMLPKEIILVPCLIAIGVNGINFSMKILRSRSVKSVLKGGFKADFFSYCFVVLFFSLLMLVGLLIEAYVIPVFIRIISPIILK